MKTAGAAAILTGFFFVGLQILENPKTIDNNVAILHEETEFVNDTVVDPVDLKNKSLSFEQTLAQEEENFDINGELKEAFIANLQSIHKKETQEKVPEMSDVRYLMSKAAHLLAFEKFPTSILTFPSTSSMQDELSYSDQLKIAENTLALAHQEETDDKRNRWSVRGEISPSYNGTNNASTPQMMTASSITPSSSMSSSLGGGLSVEKKLGKRLRFRSGILFASINQTSRNIVVSNRSASSNPKALLKAESAVHHEMVINSQAGPIEIDQPVRAIQTESMYADMSLSSVQETSVETTLKQNFDYLEIPVFAAYAIVDKRFSVDLLGGFSSNFLLENKAYFSESGNSTTLGSTSGMKSILLSTSAGVGLSYEFIPRLSLNVEPRVKYFLSSLNSNSEVNYQPYTFMVSTGISFEF